MKEIVPKILVIFFLVKPFLGFGQNAAEIEWRYIKMVKSYAQLKALLQIMPDSSINWSFIPSIFPVNVPVRNYRISSSFGSRYHPVTGKFSFHNGIDLPAPAGTGVQAAAGGIVEEIVVDGGALGNYVIVDHFNGFKTIYGHLQAFKVSKGQRVGKGQLIALVGATGRTTGPHLHYIIKKEGIKIDPFDFCLISLKRRRVIREKKDISPKIGSEVVKNRFYNEQEK